VLVDHRLLVRLGRGVDAGAGAGDLAGRQPEARGHEGRRGRRVADPHVAAEQELGAGGDLGRVRRHTVPSHAVVAGEDHQSHLGELAGRDLALAGGQPDREVTDGVGRGDRGRLLEGSAGHSP
jgi:hypothetical protein